VSSTDLEVNERRPLTPLDIGATKAAQRLYQEGLQQLLDRTEDVTPIRGRGGKVKNHVNRSGVSKITTWCAISTTREGVEIDRDAETDKPKRWQVTVRATAPDGRVADGVGVFDVKERPSSKPEHDGLATAYTRARNRAVMDLVGMGEVSAEEMTAGADTDGVTLAYGAEADSDVRLKAVSAIQQMWPNVTVPVAEQMLEVIGNALGYLPEAAARTVSGLAWCVSTDPATVASASGQAPAGPQEGAGEPTGGTEQTFEDVVTPAPEDVTTPPVANPEAPGDEVDIDAIFDAEQQYQE
jgi:hypothetical protein